MQPVTDIRQMKSSDLTMLHNICCEAYSQNFYRHWEEGGLENYINKIFGITVLKNELTDERIQYHVLFHFEETITWTPNRK